LGLYPQAFTLLLANLDLLLHHDGPLDGHVVFRFHVFQRRRLVARLAFEVVALYFNVAQLHLERSVLVTQRGDLLLQGVLRVVGLGLALLVLGLRLW
jgi:hypothetical protein